MSIRYRISGIVAVASLLVAAPLFAQGQKPSGESTAPASGGPTDPQIAAIVVAANQADIDAAKVAKMKTKNKDVKEFAETMIRDHEGVNKQAKALVAKLKVKPEANPTSKSLTDGGKENIASLKKLKGAEFDKAYVGHEVEYHQQVLDAINKTLIPNAQNADLKALLEKSAPAFEAHLEHAKKLQGELESGSASTK